VNELYWIYLILTAVGFGIIGYLVGWHDGKIRGKKEVASNS